MAPSGWVKAVKEARNGKHKFEVVFVQHPLTDDMESDGMPIVKVKDFKEHFRKKLREPDGISKYQGSNFLPVEFLPKYSLLDPTY